MGATRPIEGLPERFLAGIRFLTQRENAVRDYTLAEHCDLAGYYVIGIDLLAQAFAVGRSYEYRGSDLEPPGVQAHNLRQQLLGHAARMGKPAFDSVTAGYYGEGAGLARTMLESWGRAVFVRLRNQEFGRWWSPPFDMPGEERLRWGYGKPEVTFGSEIAHAIEASGTRRDKAIMEEALLRYRLLSALAHPSGESIHQVRSEIDDTFRFGPDYSETYCRHAFTHSLFALLALLSEIRELGDHPPQWIFDAEELDRAYERLRRADGPVLDEVRREMEAERREAARLRAERVDRERAA